MTSRLEKQIKKMSRDDIPEVVIAVTKKYGNYRDFGNDDLGQRCGYNLKHKELNVNMFYRGEHLLRYAIATINGRAVFLELNTHLNYEYCRNHTYVTRSKSKLKQLEKLLLEVSRERQRKK